MVSVGSFPSLFFPYMYIISHSLSKLTNTVTRMPQYGSQLYQDPANPSPIKTQEHDSITEIKLVRRRTLAAQKSENQPLNPPWDGNSFPMREAQSAAPNRDGNMVLEAIYDDCTAKEGTKV